MGYPVKSHVQNTLKRLLQLVPLSDRPKPHIFLLAGSDTPFRNDTDRELLFRQESNFHYLSGCQVPSSLLLVSYTPSSSIETESDSDPDVQLFIPAIQSVDLMWSVPPPTLEEATALYKNTGIASIKYTSEFPDRVMEVVKANAGAIVHILPHDDDPALFPRISKELLSSIAPNGIAPTSGLVTATAGRHSAKLNDGYLLTAIHQARLIKTPEEIDRIRKANAISSRAHEVVMRVLGKGVREGKFAKSKDSGRIPLPGDWLIEKEGEAEAIFVASCRREGSIHQAYLPIVASSTRASTLHYCCNDRAFAWGPLGDRDHCNEGDVHTYSTGGLEPQVLLIDAGCEWECYASDITRTMPVGNGGRFTKEAGEIYDLVLGMQKASFRVLKPDVHWDTVHHLCHLTLIKGFLRLGIFLPPSPGTSEQEHVKMLLNSGLSASFFPHGLGHSLGMDVHDVPSASKPFDNPTLNKRGWSDGCGPDGHESYYSYLRLRLPLEVGMVVTVEPGIYFHQHLLASVRSSPLIDHEVLKRYENLGGVRIEDVVVILDREGSGLDGSGKNSGGDGGWYENLTTVGSTREWVEAICSGSLE